MNTNNNNSGFTLIEMSFVIVIIGLLLSGFFAYLNMQLERDRLDKMAETKSHIRTSLSEYISDISDKSGANFAYTRWDLADSNANDAVHYPCPASLTAAIGDANFGVESRNTATGRCDSSIPGVFQVIGAGGQNVFIGAVPTSTMGIESEYMKDPYNSKLTYAVSDLISRDLALQGGASLPGAITINDNTDPATPVITTANFVIVSHGQNKKGAYLYSTGTRYDNCTGSQQDQENCDLTDATFTATLHSESTTNDYYDDDMAFTLQQGTGLNSDQFWDETPSNANDIYNLNSGNVGIGTDTPTTKFYVQGNSTTDGNLDVTGTSTLNSNVTINANTAIGQNLDVTGTSILRSNVTMSADALIGQDLDVTGTSAFRSNVISYKGFEVKESALVRKNLNIGQDLDVTGESRFRNNGQFDQNLRVKGRIFGENNLSLGRGNAESEGSLALSGTVAPHTKHSIAAGWKSYAGGKFSNSYAFGWNARAEWSNSFAFGPFSKTTGWGSIALGQAANADNNWSMAVSLGGIAGAHYTNGPKVQSYGTVGYFLGQHPGVTAGQSRSFIIMSDNANKRVVGINTTTPDATLDVNGDVRIGSTNNPCNATREGTQRYNKAIKKMQFCNGANWISM